MSRRKPSATLLAIGALTLLLGLQSARGDWDRLWMMWPEARPDQGRASWQTDTTGEFSTKRVLVGRTELRKTPTPATPDSIPMPIEPGSRVGSIEIPPESITQLVKPTVPASAPATAPATTRPK